ncbi:anaerobic sulfite reductase subunit AsrA [Clostridium estertheticum]|uniref:anaerobic sulfite reductase subunit AsrA n=1 Tax=Clostridium estertheticum TaxID=238834 RepID=UPI001C6F075B|nr:anaerobic sulfite reductase subunit AsrA [Clostridium estertheticum]MBW9170061.1 anaerobic sulfite reductase subunit AsrA [Clostridium estertheticum]WLC75587.1 anaerobic sulfite reductase subunit AsrA [Clostridium estertheticum]
MGFRLKIEKFDEHLERLRDKYKVYAPVKLKGKGTFADTDTIRYKEIISIKEIEFNTKSTFSPKEIILPITQTLFYFTEDECKEPKEGEKKILIFLRSCDIHAMKRLDEVYLRNGDEDYYYKTLREKAKFVLMGCSDSFENCFCASMGSNKTDDYDMYTKIKNDEVFVECKSEELMNYFNKDIEGTIVVEPEYVSSNDIKVTIPENLDQKVFKSKMWDEYSSRCIACGRCNFVCGTCSCFTMQDIFSKDNKNVGERRRIWSSCQVDGFSDMAGGHGFRKDKKDRMRFKVMHKVYDFKKRAGYHMCVGCGRCDDICPEYISFSSCVNKLSKVMEAVE